MPIRVYRPAIVIGSSEDGEADRVDGIYYSFKIIQRLRDALPPWVPLVGLEGGRLNLVPGRLRRPRDRPHRRPSRASTGRRSTSSTRRRAASATRSTPSAGPRTRPSSPSASTPAPAPCCPADLAAMLAELEGLPDRQASRCWRASTSPRRPSAMPTSRTRFTSRNAEAALEGSGIERAAAPRATPGRSGTTRSATSTPRRQRRPTSARRSRDKVALVTGASSGIGRATAAALGRHGAEVVLVSAGPGRSSRSCRPRSRRRAARSHVYPTRPRPTWRRATRMVARGAHGPRPRRHPGQQRRPLDPPLGPRLARPLPRLPADDAAELLRRRSRCCSRCCPGMQRAQRGPRHQHLQHRRPGLPAALRRLRRLARARWPRSHAASGPRSPTTASRSPTSTCRWCARR